MLGIIQAAREAGKCSIAQRLYANRAQAGDVPIALAYAQEYDPAGYKENACFKADAATAAYWYQAVLDKDKDNAQALARLEGSAEMRNIALALGLISLVTAHAAPPLLQEGKKTLYQRVLTTPGCALHEAPGGKPGAVQPTFSRFYVYAGKDEAGKSWVQVGPDSLARRWVGSTGRTVDWRMQMSWRSPIPPGAIACCFSRTDRPWTRCSTPLTQSKRSRLCASS